MSQSNVSNSDAVKTTKVSDKIVSCEVKKPHTSGKKYFWASGPANKSAAWVGLVVPGMYSKIYFVGDAKEPTVNLRALATDAPVQIIDINSGHLDKLLRVTKGPVLVIVGDKRVKPSSLPSGFGDFWFTPEVSAVANRTTDYTVHCNGSLPNFILADHAKSKLMCSFSATFDPCDFVDLAMPEWDGKLSAGDRVLLVGPSRSGKSNLALNLFNTNKDAFERTVRFWRDQNGSLSRDEDYDCYPAELYEVDDALRDPTALVLLDQVHTENGSVLSEFIRSAKSTIIAVAQYKACLPAFHPNVRITMDDFVGRQGAAVRPQKRLNSHIVHFMTPS